MSRRHDPYYDHKVYHFAALFSSNGDVSASCYARPRRINLARGQSWTITERFVTCPRCRKLLPETGLYRPSHTSPQEL